MQPDYLLILKVFMRHIEKFHALKSQNEKIIFNILDLYYI